MAETCIIESKIWPRERIHAELVKLDRMTGLSGAELPFDYTRWYGTLGMFYTAREGRMLVPGKFSFSVVFLDDTTIPDEINIDTIRHEYAHYMDFVLYGNIGHSRTWKKCCGDVGIPPSRTFSEYSLRYYRRLHRIESENELICSGYTEGQLIFHKLYGIGEILTFRDMPHDRILEVSFEDGSVRKLSALWVHENCA